MPIVDETDVSLPRATLTKMIRERMPSDLRLGADSLDIVIECCTEFVNLLSAESNDVASSEKKNMIHPEHVLKALEDLGFGEFVPDVRETWEAWKEENKNKSGALRPKGHKTAADAAGYSEEQQIVMQQKLFAEAKARSNSFQEPIHIAAAPEDRPNPDGPPLDVPARFGSLTTSGTPSDLSISTPSAMYAELSARSDVLPIHPLPVPPMSSEFKPHVISSASCAEKAPEESTEVENMMTGPALDMTAVSMNTPVLFWHNGVQHCVSWQNLVSQAMQPQYNQGAASRPHVPSETSIQMPVASTQMPAMQPSFPEPIPMPPHSTAPPQVPIQAEPSNPINSKPDSEMKPQNGQESSP